MGRPSIRRSCILPKLLITSTPTTYPPSCCGSLREAVPIPPLKSQVTIPVPPPTFPSATAPPEAFSIASNTCFALMCWPPASFSQESSHSPTTGITTSCSTPMPGYWPTRYSTVAAEQVPTESVFVRKIGVSIRPHSFICVRPETSPAPLRMKVDPTTRSRKTFPRLGRIAVTPVRTGPFPARSLPVPDTRVVCPTRTPGTSVIAL